MAHIPPPTTSFNPMLLLYGLAGAFFTAAALVTASKALKNDKNLSASTTVFCSYAVATLLLIAFVKPLPLLQSLPATEGGRYVLISAALLCASRLLYTKAFALIEVAHVTLFSALTPLYAIATAYFLLDEVPTAMQLAGIVLVVVALVGVYYTPLALQYRHSAGYVWAFLSTVIAAFSVIFQKKALTSYNFIELTFLNFLLIACMAGVIRLLLNLRAGQRTPWITHAKLWLALGALTAAAHLCFFYIIPYTHVAVAQATQRMSMLFQIVLAYYILRERDDIKRHMLAAVVSLAGIYLMYLP